MGGDGSGGVDGSEDIEVVDDIDDIDPGAVDDGDGLADADPHTFWTDDSTPPPTRPAAMEWTR